MNYTNLDQSRKLVELGLNPDTADMCWTNHCYGPIRSTMRSANMTIDEYKKLLERFADSNSSDVFYPCWSVNALMQVIGNFGMSYHTPYGKTEMSMYSHEHLEPSAVSIIDLCYNMVVWLLENKKI